MSQDPDLDPNPEASGKDNPERINPKSPGIRILGTLNITFLSSGCGAGSVATGP